MGVVMADEAAKKDPSRYTNYIMPGELCGAFMAMEYMGNLRWKVLCTECHSVMERHSSNVRRGGPCRKCADEIKRRKKEGLSYV